MAFWNKFKPFQEEARCVLNGQSVAARIDVLNVSNGMLIEVSIYEDKQDAYGHRSAITKNKFIARGGDETFGETVQSLYVQALLEAKSK